MAEIERMLQISELEELRLESYDNAVNYKKRMKRLHDMDISHWTDCASIQFKAEVIARKTQVSTIYCHSQTA